MLMRRIVELRAGAHLYGTATPRSDTDLKSVHLPDARDILLQRARSTVTTGRLRPDGEANRADDTDHESHSLHRFVDLLLEGQPIALEMLFAPDWAMTAPCDPLWRELQALSPHLVSRRASIFLRYARQQAERYGARGARAAAAARAHAMLEQAEATHGGTARLLEIEPELARFVASVPHTALIDIPIADGRTGRHLDICGRKAPLHASVRTAREMAARLHAEYGDRALAAADGTDWKALSHAVRVGQEAIELLDTGRLTLPRPDAPRLLAIKLGQMPPDEVGAEIERLFTDVEAAAARSALPAAPDEAAAQALVLRAYRRHVIASL